MAKFAGYAHYVRCATKHPKSLECAKKKSTCRAPPSSWVCGPGAEVRNFAPPRPNLGWVSSVWVYPSRTRDLREWVPEVEVINF